MRQLSVFSTATAILLAAVLMMASATASGELVLTRGLERLIKKGGLNREHVQKIAVGNTHGKQMRHSRKLKAELQALFESVENRHRERKQKKKIGGGDDCPPDTTPCSDTCCQNGQGINAEACCPDPTNGGICCITEQTFCCPPQPERDLPSHCCPQWNVCCDHGRYGCCDPDTMLPMEAEEAYAIIQEQNLFGNADLYGTTIDTYNASIGTQVKLPHTYHTDGEIPRSFMFSRSTGNFYMMQANYTENPSKGPNPDRQINFFDVNPRTGTIGAKKVAGAYDRVTGYHFVDELEKVVFSTPLYNSSGDNVGFNFYHLDPATAEATFISKFDSTHTEGYSGWFHEVSADGKTLYRLGYQDEVRSFNFGVEVTDISTNPATSNFVSVSGPLDYTNYRSINKLPSAPSMVENAAADGQYFVSLAGNENITTGATGDMAVFVWDLMHPTTAPTKVHSFPNAHRTPYFGPIQETVSPSGDIFACFVAQASPLGQNWDTWGFGLVNLNTGNTTEATLSPTMLAGTAAVAGLGITKESMIWQKLNKKL